jgi:predicted ATPase
MLKSFRISNFRSLVNVEFRPVGSNLLIGPNNAGKTSLCSGLRFLSLTASLDLETAAQHAVGETWNIANAYVNDRTLRFDVKASLDDGGQTLDFDYTLVLSVANGSADLGVTVRAEEERLLVTGGKFAQTVLLDCTKAQAQLLHEEQFLQGGAPHKAETLSPPDATMLSRLYDLHSNRRANLFKQYLQSWRYFNLDPHAMRSHQVVSEKPPTILTDGSNLSKVLFALHNEQPRVERKIIESIKAIEPKIDLFSFRSPDPQSVYLFMEDREQNRFGMQSVSDGTLRYLVFAILVHGLAENRAMAKFSPLVIIEEPENGLYVGQLKPLFEKVDSSGASGQFVFTSHSPYFIDLWENNLAGVHLLKPGKPSSVLVVPDQDKLKKLLAEMPLGELHFREMLS